MSYLRQIDRVKEFQLSHRLLDLQPVAVYIYALTPTADNKEPIVSTFKLNLLVYPWRDREFHLSPNLRPVAAAKGNRNCAMIAPHLINDHCDIRRFVWVLSVAFFLSV